MTHLITALLVELRNLTAIVGMLSNPPEGPRKVNADALLLLDLKQRIDKYMELHNRLEKERRALKRTDEPAKDQSVAGCALRRPFGPSERAPNRATSSLRRSPTCCGGCWPRKSKGKRRGRRRRRRSRRSSRADRLKVNARVPGRGRCPPYLRTCSRRSRSSPRISNIGSSGKHLILRDVHANVDRRLPSSASIR